MSSDAGVAKPKVGGGWGEPHLYTFDGALFDFQYVGEFVLARDGADTIVQVRLAPYHGSRTIATIVAVAAEVNGNRIEVDSQGVSGTELWINGALSTTSVAFPNGGSASLSSVTWSDGTQLSIIDRGKRLDVQLTVPPRAGWQGLLGNANGDVSDDQSLRDGTAFTRPLSTSDWTAFSQAWRISQAESLFRYDSGQDTSTFTDLSFPYGPATATGLTPEVYAAARATCLAAAVSAPALLDACILDVGTTQDNSFASSAAVIPPPVSGEPTIYDTSVDGHSQNIDKLAPFALSPDGTSDGAFDVTLRGPIAGLVLLAKTASGAESGQWNTLMSQPVPPDVPTSYPFVGRYLLRVEENGQLLNNQDGSLGPLDGGIHHLIVYSANGSLSPVYAGLHLRFYGLLPNSRAVQGPEVVY
jgi:hypothetical protein